jgi:hypothetical protein
MALYTTRTLAEQIMPDAAENNIKTATRTLRKFLRDELGNGGAVVGKGARYSLDLKAAELRAMKKKFAAWEIAQEEAKAARAAALEAAKAPKTPAVAETTPDSDDADNTDEAPESDNDDIELEGPSDEEIAAMLSDDDEADTEV